MPNQSTQDIRFMKSLVFPCLAALGLATAHGQSKPGSISPLLFESTITTENAPTVVQLPNNGGTRSTLTVSSVRFINRDILEAMRVGSLLDGTLTGWTLNRLANPAGVGNLYATKPGKTAVLVPATLLTQPVVQGTATTGNLVTPTTGLPKPNLYRRVYATLAVRNGASSAAGSQVLKFGTFRSGTTSTIVATQTDVLNVSGKSGTGAGIIGGSYRIQRCTPTDLAPLIPGAGVP